MFKYLVKGLLTNSTVSKWKNTTFNIQHFHTTVVKLSSGNQSIRDLVLSINKKLGAGTVRLLGDEAMNDIPKFSSGSALLDQALGGGWPLGRVVEIYGTEGSGKTTLALHAVAELQKIGHYACFIDCEHALNVEYAKAIGIDFDNLLFVQPENGEQGFQVADECAKSGKISLVVIDSVAALVPRSEIEGAVGDTITPGAQARLMSYGLRRLSGTAARNNCTCLFINQLRNKIGVLYGNPEITSGGKALKYYASVRIEIRRKEDIMTTQGPVGIKVKVKVVKNKVASPYKEAIIALNFGRGLSVEGDVFDVALSLGIITAKGSHYYLAGQKLGQGRERVKEFLYQNPQLLEVLQSTIKRQQQQYMSQQQLIVTQQPVYEQQVLQQQQQQQQQVPAEPMQQEQFEPPDVVNDNEAVVVGQ
eukprot:TRINITY_DN16115_c0_g1_i1.p1 TRINITY_DN16115_c0_g1~~TRINITY_DN16115_c0_g1_i1.p1  ORF type:complete len:418 (-),score=57.70 TRINITY_DN16115_c0_g1_i1:163-1416(-)